MDQIKTHFGGWIGFSNGVYVGDSGYEKNSKTSINLKIGHYICKSGVQG